MVYVSLILAENLYYDEWLAGELFREEESQDYAD